MKMGKRGKTHLLPYFVMGMIAAILLTGANLVNAQNGARKSKKNSPVAITPDSSLKTIQSAQTGFDSPIKYDARIIDNDVNHRITYLIGDAVVKYKTMVIEAGKITVDLTRKILIAEPLVDTLAAATDSLGQDGHADTVRVKKTGYPVFSDGSDQMRGEKMEYNFDTGKGLVVRGRTDFEGGKYFGQQIKRVSENVLFVSRGTYITCDLEEHPHYHCWARRMKIIVGKRVIAKPVVMYLGHVPIAILPFAMFPTQTGRRSGLIVPRYGVSAREGRYLRELGYYWAASDYFDARATVDFYEKSGWLFKAGFNYALRYNFTGGLSGSLTRKNFSNGSAERRWDLTIRHNQTLGKTASLRVNGTFLSDNSFYRDFSFNQTQRLTRRLRSQGTFTKSWPKLRSNLTISVSDEKDLEDGSVTRLLPSIQFYFSERRLFGGKAKNRGRGGSPLGGRTGSTGLPGSKWYENIYFRYNVTSQSLYKRQRTGASGEFKTDRRSVANHDISLRMTGPTKLFGWLRLSQGLTIDEDWFDRENRFQDSTLTVTENKGFFARHTFNYQAAMNTTVYGLFQPHIGPIKAIRHVMTPSISFSYRPDFSSPFWGYYVSVKDQTGKVVKKDRFSGTPRGKLASMNVSISNLLQLKTQSGEKEKKIDLFRMNVSAGYNFAAQQKKLSNINTSINAQPSRQVSFTLSMSHSPYVFQQTGEKTGQEINKYLFAEKGFFSGKWLRLTSLNISSNIRLQGKGAGNAGAPGKGAMQEPAAQYGATEFNRFEEEQQFSNLGIPWQLSFTLRYSLGKFNPLSPTRRAYIDISNAEFQVSKNWRVRFRGQIDLKRKQMVGQHWSIYRDLHCWEASFNWTPIGPGRGFYLRINIKAPQLRDIKFEKHGGRSSIFGGNYFY